MFLTVTQASTSRAKESQLLQDMQVKFLLFRKQLVIS